jgi:MYXO-CTERM domain-containing protein
VRDGTINLPATHPSIVSVGCTINKPSWTNVHDATLGLTVPILDAAGDMVDPAGVVRDALPGEPCWFSSAGPTLTGLQKPEIMAPGAAIVGALSAQAVPPVTTSIFTNPECPDKSRTGVDPECQEVDSQHAASFGTSFSSPLVAGAVAVLLQHDPSLTQDVIVAALQGGAHPLRGPSAYDDQSGVGELDVPGALAAADALRDPQMALPARETSWITLGADPFLADGSTPMQAIIELRVAKTSASPPPAADGFGDGRLAAYARVDGATYAGAIASLTRRGPGVWVATVQLPAGLGGSILTVGATFDGKDIVDAKSVPIATDVWNAGYPASIHGGCAVGTVGASTAHPVLWIATAIGLVAARRRRVTA